MEIYKLVLFNEFRKVPIFIFISLAHPLRGNITVACL